MRAHRVEKAQPDAGALPFRHDDEEAGARLEKAGPGREHDVRHRLAFQKAWRRNGGQCVLLNCHYDIIDWLEPDWIFDTATGRYAGRYLWRRPRIHLSIRQTDWRYCRYLSRIIIWKGESVAWCRSQVC